MNRKEKLAMPDWWRLSNIVLWLYYSGIAAVLLLVAARVAQLQHQVPQPLTGLPPGTPAPQFTTTDLSGAPLTIPATGCATLLVFASATCATCYEIMPQVNHLYKAYNSTIVTIIISPGSVARAKRFVEEAQSLAPLVVDAGLIAAAYQVNVSPTIVLIAADGQVIKCTRIASLAVSEVLTWLQQRDVG